MDVNEFIKNNGQRLVPNPAYNPKSKKNTQPSSILVPDIGLPNDVATNMAVTDYLNQYSINAAENEKYREKGLNWNPRENFDLMLAESQSNWSKAVNALGQTLVSEIGIGIPKGVSDLIDAVGQAFGLSDPNYSNPVSQYLEEKQKEFEEWAPVYVDPNNNTLKDQFTGGFNLGYWFSNIPSIASSLTLLIPSTGIVKGASMIGKAFNTTRRLSKFTNRAARAIANPVAHAFGRSGFTSAEMGVAFETGINAALSRTMENYQEARQTYNDSYIDMSNTLNNMSDEEYNNFLQRNAQYLADNNVDTTDRDSVAKQLARSAADRTFQLDFANVVFDAYQIYGLRNLLTHAPRFNQSAATRAAQRNAMRTAGMTEEQAAAELAKDSRLTKIGYWVNDNLFGFGRQIKSELSEGVEEAVNYIAQQEGTHLGKYLLTGENGDSRDLNLLSSIGPMTSRILNDYYNDTGLWDSAFWGVVGGVVFQAGGSKLNRISQTIKNRQAEKKSTNKDNAETQEAKVTPHWWALDQSAETERMLTEIKGRNHKLNTLRTQMQKINAGKNPYIVNEDKTNPDISSPVEERMLREKAYTEYLDEMIITARNNGTLDMLEAYLEDSNVQEAIVAAYQSGDNANRVSKEEAQQAAAKASERVKKIDRMYQNEIIHASDIADKVGDKEGTSLPAEYIQMIASSNVRHRLNLERYDEVAAMYNEDTERIKAVLGDKFDSSIDYQGLISLRATIQELSGLVAQKKELEAKQKEKPTLTTQFDIEEIDNQINLIKRKALQTSTDAQFARTLYALQVANSAVREYAPDGKSFKVNASDADLIANLDNFLMNDLSHIFDEVGQEKRDNISNDAVLGELRKVMNDMRYVLPVDANGKRQDTESYLENLDPKLPENYDILARIELEKIKENARLAETEQEIRHYVSAINNMENVARKRVIEDAFNTLSDIQKNHTDLDIMQIANGIYDENNADWLIATNGLTDEERTNLREALKVLNLADVKNRTLFDTLAKTLMYTRATQTQVAANNKQNTEPAQATTTQPGTSAAGTQTQNSGTSQNQTSAQPTGQPINQSQQGSNAATGQGNGQIQQNNIPNAIGLGVINGKDVFYNATNNTAPALSIPVKDLGNGNYELDFISKGSNVHIPDISNNRLFDVQQQPMDGAIVKRNPIVRFGNNNEVQVVSQGLVENPSISSTGEQGGSTANAQSYIDRMESANTHEEVDAIYREALNNGIQEREIFPTYSRKHKEIDDAKKSAGPETPVRGADPAVYVPQIAGVARAAAMKLKNGETVTYEEYLGSLTDIKATINDDVTFERLAKDSWQTAMQRLAKKYPEAVDSIINTLQSSTTEEVPESNLKRVFDKTFTNAVEKLVKAYLKDIGQKKVNGKYVISLENLLRYCNGEFQNNENAEILYNVLASYLKSDEASSLYDVIETEEEIAAPDFLDNVKMPLEERIDKAIRQENHRINTIGIRNKEVFDELEEGQELSLRETKDRIYFTFDGKDVGYIGKPKVVNGTYSSPYEYWLFRIRPNGKDTYYSKLAEVFKAIVNARDGELKEIYDAALSGSWNLEDNATWDAIKAEYAINTVDNETGEEKDDVDAKMLGVIRTMASFAVKYGSADKAIDGWFNALAQEYIAADYLAKNKDTKITVDAISDGFLIKATDKLTDDNRNIIQSEVNKLPLASQAIGRNNKGKVSIAVGSRRQAGAVECVVKKENDKVTIPATYSFPGVGYSNTFVAIPISKGRVLFAQAYPITARELTRDSEAAKIVSAFSNQVIKYLDAISRNPGNDQLFRELQDFLFEALNYKNSTTPLFHMDNCEKVNNGDDRGTHIGTNGRRGPRRDLRIFCNPGKTHTIEFEDSRIKDSNGRNIKNRINITPENIDTIKTEIKNFLADTLQFNISEAYIASDNNTRNQVEGLATRDKDGKFVVKIGDESWTFNSYNDFILDNDLVRVNTKPNEHGNNVTRTSNNPNVRYKIVTSTPVERNVPSSQPVINVAQEANTIMSSSRTDKAAALARLIFDDDTVTTLSVYDLLPHNLVFDAAFNTGDGREKLNASFNKNTKVTTIGPRFLSMLSSTNDAYRKQAIRKLIHERLHDILHSNGNEYYINDIRSIYDTFVESLDNAEAAKPILEKYLKKNNLNIYLDNYYENFKKYKYLSKQSEEERLEEFLVDTLTSVELANYLNNVTSLSKVNMRERKRDTLLNKIMRLLAKIMGINIKNDSLYAQEFEALRKAMDTTAEQTMQFEEETTENVQQTAETQQPQVEETPAVPENKNIFTIINDETDDDEYSSTTEEYRKNDYTKEMNNIKERAIANGTFMKAPNGKSTNLTERQWLQVRTKNFINWFGDWINDPENASKVVDENGEPLVRYHQTNENITIFDSNRSDNGFTDFETPIGIFTKESPNNIFGGKNIQMPLFVKTNNILSFNTRKEAQEYFSKNIPSYKEKVNYINHLNDDDPFSIESSNSYEISEELKTSINNYLKESGFDGFELVNDEGLSSTGLSNVHTIVVFNSNQVKSAIDNTGAFSSDNNDIRYSSTFEEYEQVASIADYIWSYSPEDRAEIAREINNGELSIKCK